LPLLTNSDINAYESAVQKQQSSVEPKLEQEFNLNALLAESIIKRMEGYKQLAYKVDFTRLIPQLNAPNPG